MSAESASSGGAKASAPEVWSAGRRNYVLAVLCVVGLFNFVDRQIITILIEPIKKEGDYALDNTGAPNWP